MLRRNRQQQRRGAVLILTALLTVVMFGMVAFAIDVGYVALVRSELQRAADAAALAGAGELLDKDALKGTPNSAQEQSAAVTTATAFAAANPAGGKSLSLPTTDILIGSLLNPTYPAPDPTPSTTPNAVKVLLRRDDIANDPADLFFGVILGKTEQTVTAQATAYYLVGIKGFRVPYGANYNAAILPYTLNVVDWDAAFATGSDNFTHNATTKAVASGGDGIKEVKLFPLDSGANGKSGVTPGNFGTIDIGSPNNSTADLARQILYGQNAYDMSFFPNSTLQLGNNGYVMLNGDTGISAGVKDELNAIKGQPRVLPLYETVTGNGNNAQFKIVRFVGCTIVDVQLTGSLSSKHITIQPAFVIEPSAIGGGTEGSTSVFIKRPLALVE